MKSIQSMAFGLIFLLAAAGCTSSKNSTSSGVIECFRPLATPSWQPQAGIYNDPIPTSWKTKSTAPPTAKITTAWKTPSAIPMQYARILVLGILPEESRHLQKSIETRFVNDLTRLGYQVVSSLEEFGPNAFNKHDEKVTLSQLKNHNVDAVITITLPGKGRERKCMPGNIYHASYGYYYTRLWSYANALYHRIADQEIDSSVTKFFWETNLYHISGQQLIYTAQTRSFDPAGTEGLEYGSMIIKNMLKQNVLQAYERRTDNNLAKGK